MPTPPKRRAPTLYAIVAIKLARGATLLLLSLGIVSLANNDLPADFREFLHRLQLDPESAFWAKLADRIRQVTPSNVYWVASGTALYSLFSFIEGAGLARRARWAGWMAIGESAFFIPLEIYDLMRQFSKTVAVILVLNTLIVFYLYSNRERLFRRHEHADALGTAPVPESPT